MLGASSSTARIDTVNTKAPGFPPAVQPKLSLPSLTQLSLAVSVIYMFNFKNRRIANRNKRGTLDDLGCVELPASRKSCPV